MTQQELIIKLKSKVCASCANRLHTSNAEYCELRHSSKSPNNKLQVTLKTAACFQYSAIPSFNKKKNGRRK